MAPETPRCPKCNVPLPWHDGQCPAIDWARLGDDPNLTGGAQNPLTKSGSQP